MSKFLLPLVLTGGAVAGGTSSLLVKESAVENANVVTLFKRKNSGSLKLGNHENVSSPENSSGVMVLSKDSWKHSENKSNNSSFRLMVEAEKDSNKVRQDVLKDAFDKKQVEDEKPKEVAVRENGSSEAVNRKTNDKVNGTATIYLDGTTCDGISNKFVNMKYKNHKEEKDFLSVFTKNEGTMLMSSDNSSFVIWGCENLG